MNSDDERLKLTVKRVVELLVLGRFDALEKLSKGNRLTANEMREAVMDFPATFVMPVNNVFENLDVIEIGNTNPTEWSVRFDLWTKEGRSDLSLELTLIKTNSKLFNVEIDSIHVL